SLGHTVQPQVGCAGFFIDLAVVDPRQPGRYLLGIECDGATYHRARSARDRDRLRQAVLEGLGWRIHRIWSTDWYRNPERELKRVEEAIKKASFMLPVDNEEDMLLETRIDRDTSEETDHSLPPYQVAALPAEVSGKELHQHSIG